MSSLQSWPLERFSKCVCLPSMPQSYRDPSNWKEISKEKSEDLKVSCIGSRHILISSTSRGESHVHESFSLYEAKKWLRAAAKGDSVLFMYKNKDDTRRFRIKFCKTSSKSSLESCRDFVKSMSSSFSIKEVPVSEHDSQVPMEDSQAFPSSQASSSSSENTGAVVSLGEMARKPSRPCDMQKAYENTNIPTSRLGLHIRLCLTDANFPAFVEAVEKELSELVTKK